MKLGILLPLTVYPGINTANLFTGAAGVGALYETTQSF